MKIFFCILFFRRILISAGLFLIFSGVLFFPVQGVDALNSLYGEAESYPSELFYDRAVSAGKCRQDCGKQGKVSDSWINSVRSAVSINPKRVFLSRKGYTVRPPMFIYVGTSREFLRKTNYRLMFTNGENTLSSYDPLIIPLLSIKGTLQPGATKMGLSFLSLLHMPFFQSGRFGLRQR